MSGQNTLYSRVGEAEGIRKFINAFYDVVVADEELGPFFQSVDVDKIRRMQEEFFSAALGGPVEYTGMELARTHHGVAITRNHFSRYVHLLFETLKETGIDDSDRTEIIDRINLYVDDIVGRGGMDG